MNTLFNIPVHSDARNSLSLSQYSCVAIEAEEIARLLDIITRQRDALEARYLELQRDREGNGTIPGVPRISGFAHITGNATSSAPRSARRPDTPGTSIHGGSTPRGWRAGDTPLQVAIKRLERELELETKRRESAEREVHRLRILTDRARYTKKYHFQLTPRVNDSPRLAPCTTHGVFDQTMKKPVLIRRSPIVLPQSNIERLTTELRGAYGKLSNLAAIDEVSEKENSQKNRSTISDQHLAISVYFVVQNNASRYKDTS